MSNYRKNKATSQLRFYAFLEVTGLFVSTKIP